MNFLKMFIPSTKDVDGYEKLQKRINEKTEFLEKIHNSFNVLSKYLKDVFNKIVGFNSSFINITFSLEEQNIQETCGLIYQKIINNMEKDNRLIEEVIKNLNEHIKSFNNEKAFYEQFKKINKELQDEKEKLKKNKELYHKAGKDAESKVKKFVETNFDNLSNLSEESLKELDGITSQPKKTLNIYKNSVEKVNQLIDKFNDNQTALFEYLPELGNEDGVFFFRLVKLYLQRLEDGEQFLNLSKKQLNESKTVETDSKLKELIENNENNKKDEKPIDLMQYQTGLDFNKCKTKKEFDLLAKTVETINNYIDKDIFNNYNYEIELKNYEIGQLIKSLFDEKDLDEQKAQKLLDSLNDKSVHKGVYIVLSQLRTNSRFKRSRPLIELLGKAFNILLVTAEQHNLYENAKNCIILSQTYFYIDENNNKVYLFELIKNNKWLQSPHFWRGFINFMITSEFARFEKTYPETNFNVEQNINITKKVKNKLNEIVFSQLLPFVSNMNDFEIDKRIILKITDEFVAKYDFISSTNLESLYGMISSDKNEIEKLRKEYNPSLEPELTTTSKENIKEDLKEKPKEKKEEEKKDIEVKEEAKDIKEGIKDDNSSKEEKKEESNKEEKKEENTIEEETKKDV